MKRCTRLQKINSLIDGNKREYNVTIIMIKSAYSMTDIITVISNQRRGEGVDESDEVISAGYSRFGNQ